MEISVTDAKDQLAELVGRAEAGDEVILTRQGRPAVRLTPLHPAPARPKLTPEERGAIIDRICADARAKVIPGPSGAELQDALYDENGLPA